MKKCILVLEDNVERRDAMKEWLDDRLPMYDLFLTDDPDQFIQYADRRREDILVVSLDHDLYERSDASTSLTGMLVVDHLVGQKPSFPVLLHTTNRPDGEKMESRLATNGWDVRWVHPFDGTSWVATDWYHQLKRAIRRQSQKMSQLIEDNKP